MKKRHLLLSLLATALLGTQGAAMGQSWPTRPVKLMVGFPGGSTPDMVARTLAEPLAKALGQPVVVENRPGASGNIAADQVAKASDDHTLGVVINGNLTTAKALDPKLAFDPAKDFTHLALLATAPLLLVAPPTAPDGAAFFAEARKQGDKWNYGSVGNGSMAHLGLELLKSQAGLGAVHVPYRGNPLVVQAMLAGDLQMALMPPGVAMPQVKAGKLKAIGLSSASSPLVPEVEPLSKAGINDFTLEVWTGLVGPASLSSAAQARINSELARIYQDPAIKQKLFEQGWQAAGSSADVFRSRVERETGLMQGIITSKGIKIE